MKDSITVRIRMSTYNAVKALGVYGDSMSDILDRLVENQKAQQEQRIREITA